MERADKVASVLGSLGYGRNKALSFGEVELNAIAELVDESGIVCDNVRELFADILEAGKATIAQDAEEAEHDEE